MEQQVKDEKHAGKLQVELTFGLKLLTQVKGKQLTRKKFQDPALRGKTQLAWTIF